MKAETPFPVGGRNRRTPWRCILAAMAFAVAVACANSSIAGPKPDTLTPKPKLSKAAKAKAPKREAIALTGSNIKHDVARRGRIALTASPLVIIGREQIERSGATTVAGVLRRTGTF